MKGSEVKMLGFMEGADKRYVFRYIRENIIGNMKTVNSYFAKLDACMQEILAFEADLANKLSQ